MRRFLSFLVVACFVSCLSIALAQSPATIAPRAEAKAAANQHFIQIKLYEKLDGSKNVLAHPTIMTGDGQPFTFVMGGEVEKTSPPLYFGTKVNGTVATNLDSTLQVALGVSLGTDLVLDDPAVKAVRSLGVELRMDLKKNESKSVQIDATHWLDIRVE